MDYRRTSIEDIQKRNARLCGYIADLAKVHSEIAEEVASHFHEYAVCTRLREASETIWNAMNKLNEAFESSCYTLECAQAERIKEGK